MVPLVYQRQLVDSEYVLHSRVYSRTEYCPHLLLVLYRWWQTPNAYIWAIIRLPRFVEKARIKGVTTHTQTDSQHIDWHGGETPVPNLLHNWTVQGRDLFPWRHSLCLTCSLTCTAVILTGRFIEKTAAYLERNPVLLLSSVHILMCNATAMQPPSHHTWPCIAMSKHTTAWLVLYTPTILSLVILHNFNVGQ